MNCTCLKDIAETIRKQGLNGMSVSVVTGLNTTVFKLNDKVYSAPFVSFSVHYFGAPAPTLVKLPANYCPMCGKAVQHG